MLDRDVPDQLHHVYGFTYTRTTEQANLTAFGERTNQVDYLDASFQQFVGGCLVRIGRSSTVNRHALFFTDRAGFVDRPTQHVHDTAQSLGAHRNLNRLTSVDHVKTTLQTFGGAHGNGTDNAVAQLLLNFQRGFSTVHGEGVIYLRYAVAREFHVDHSTDDLNNTTATHACILLTCVFAAFFLPVC